MRKMITPALVAVSMLVLAGAAQAQAAQDPHAGHRAAAANAPATGVRTSPADGWMGSTAPTAFSITFPHEMQLTGLSLKSGDAPTAAIAFASSAPATTARAPLPGMGKGNHVLTWSARGSDGHSMTGVVRFMVH